MSRCRKIRSDLGWSQKTLAAFLGVEQPTVWRLENSREETGPESRLLDLLNAAISDGSISKGATVAEAMKALGLASEASPISGARSSETTGNE
jgi:transcriptional regulator with XRE-family HTH domain